MIRVSPPLFLIAVIFSLSCSDNKQIENSNIGNVLVTIGEKTITVNDFIKRCEYVPRPNYCKNNNYIHKKIALNSLIAEKLLSLEFEKSQLSFSSAQNNLISGQKEQLMRHKMLKINGFDKVRLDPDLIHLVASKVKRTYDISFIITDKTQIKLSKLDNISRIFDIQLLANVQKGLTSKSITINDDMPIELKEILYFSNPNKEILYGPISLTKNKFMFFEVNSWNTTVSVTSEQKEQAFMDAEKIYKELQALKTYEQYVSKLMKGKSIYFKQAVFSAFSNQLSKIYLIEKEKKEDAIQNSIWRATEEREVISFDGLRSLKQEALLSFDNKDYSVIDILRMIKKHPLVFRNKNISSKDFSNELKYALVDLFRDFEITNEAYKTNLDKQDDIKNIEQKWRDHISASVMKSVFTNQELSEKKPFEALVTKIDSLQIYYSNIIKIDMDKFEKIRLTNIDMNVIYTNQAYPLFEPAFPILTTDHQLDYGQKYTFN